MTVKQIIHALGARQGDDDDPQRTKRTEILDQIMSENGWLPKRLLEIPQDEIMRFVVAKCGPINNPKILPVWLGLYLDDKQDY
jgi:hypothetical protein